MNRKTILLPLLLAFCSLVLVGAGTERAKLQAGADSSRSVEQQQTAPVKAPELKTEWP